MNPLKALKVVMAGSIGPDELSELFSSIGFDCSFTSCAIGSGPFESLGAAALAPGAELIELKGSMKGGAGLHALLVVTGKHVSN